MYGVVLGKLLGPWPVNQKTTLLPSKLARLRAQQLFCAGNQKEHRRRKMCSMAAVGTRRGGTSNALPASLAAALFLAVATASSAERLPLSGLVLGDEAVESSPPSPLTVLIRGRSLHTAVAVAHSTSSFTLPSLAEGEYILELAGSVRHDYPHLRARVDEAGALVSVEARRDPLLLPGGAAMNATDAALVFAPVGASMYGKPEQDAWALLRMLNRPFVLLQLVAGAFVLWFPRYLASIDPDMLYDLTGETPPDIGDPNAVLRQLLGDGDEDAGAVGDAGVRVADSAELLAE